MTCGTRHWRTRNSARDHDRSDPWGFAAMHAGFDRDMAHVRSQMKHGEQMARDGRAAHLRNMRRMRDTRRNGGACASSPWGYFLAYWWLIFPFVFGVLPALERVNWNGIGAGAERLALGWLDNSPAMWAVDAFARIMGMSPGDAGAMLLLAVIVNGAAIAIALRMPAQRTPRRRDRLEGLGS